MPALVKQQTRHPATQIATAGDQHHAGYLAAVHSVPLSDLREPVGNAGVMPLG